MFLIRTGFWLFLIVMMLPTDAKRQAQLTSSASYAVERAAGFCGRNPETCKTMASVWDTFSRKADYGIQLIGGLISERRAASSAEPPAYSPPALPQPVKASPAPTRAKRNPA